jgi:predicted transcriptional regulator
VKILKDVSLTIRLSQPLKDALERAAETERRSLSQLVGLALEEFLEARHEWPPPGSAGRSTGGSAARRR